MCCRSEHCFRVLVSSFKVSSCQLAEGFMGLGDPRLDHVENTSHPQLGSWAEGGRGPAGTCEREREHLSPGLNLLCLDGRQGRPMQGWQSKYLTVFMAVRTNTAAYNKQPIQCTRVFGWTRAKPLHTWSSDSPCLGPVRCRHKQAAQWRCPPGLRWLWRVGWTRVAHSHPPHGPLRWLWRSGVSPQREPRWSLQRTGCAGFWPQNPSPGGEQEGGPESSFCEEAPCHAVMSGREGPPRGAGAPTSNNAAPGCPMEPPGFLLNFWSGSLGGPLRPSPQRQLD